MYLIFYFIYTLSLLSFDINIKKQLIKDTKLYSDVKNTFLVSTLKKNSYVFILKELLNHYYVKTLDNKKGYLPKDALRDFIVKKSLGYIILNQKCNIFADKELKHFLGLADPKEKILIESYEILKDKTLFKTIYGFYVLVEKGKYLLKRKKDV